MSGPLQVVRLIDGIGVGDHPLDELGIHAVEQLIDFIIPIGNDACRGGVLLDQCFHRLIEHTHDQFGHFGQVLRRLGQRMCAQHHVHACDALGVIAHALEFTCHFDDGCQHSQIAGDGLLGGDRDQAVKLDVKSALVDPTIVDVNRASGLQIPLHQRINRVQDGLLNHALKNQQAVLEGFDIPIECGSSHFISLIRSRFSIESQN